MTKIILNKLDRIFWLTPVGLPTLPQNTVSKQMSLSDSILSGAVVSYRKAGYTFGRHLHTNIEIYRILSGECYMDIQSETLHCTKGDFIMILPDMVHSFLSE